MRYYTRHVAQQWHTVIKQNSHHTWALDERRSWVNNLCISRCRFRTSYDRPRLHKGARPVSLFVGFGPRGTSGGPRARRPAVAASAAAAAAAGAAVGTTAAAAASRTAAAATATRCPRFALILGFLGWGIPSGSDTGISAAVGRLTTGCPTALSAAPRHGSRGYVRDYAGGLIRHLPSFAHCQHSTSRAPAATVGATMEW